LLVAISKVYRKRREGEKLNQTTNMSLLSEPDQDIIMKY